MALKTDQIENKNLNGREVLEIAVQEFRAMLERDCMMAPGIAYRRVAMTLSATFQLGQPHQPLTVKSRVRQAEEGAVVEGEIPLNPPEPDTEVLALERDVDLPNPNLARVHHDLPIRLQERKPPVPIMIENPIPGEPPQSLTNPYPEIETRELRYDKTQYPAAEPPVDRDVSEEKAGGLGLKPRGRPGKNG